jgi:glycosyltransferase involved in cell wall biosynthesis
VLLVTDAVGGVWVYSLELARALLRLGVEPVLAVTGPSPSEEQRAQAAGVEVVDTGLPLEWLDTTPASLREASRALSLVADERRIDVVQTCSAAILADADFSQPCVAVQHSCLATWWAAVKSSPLPDEFRWRCDLVQQGLERAGAVVAPTRAFAAATQQTYALRQAVTAVYNGRSEASVRALPQAEFVLVAGRLWDEAKNAAVLDRAAAISRVVFRAAGRTTGPNGAAIEIHNMDMLGELSSDRLRGLFGLRPVFASAALYEPFGLTALEAAQAGCALVLSDIATHRELWDGAAMFVSPRDERGFAAAVDSLFADPGERERLGRAAEARARHYSINRTAEEMIAIYSQLVHSHASAAQLMGAA